MRAHRRRSTSDLRRVRVQKVTSRTSLAPIVPIARRSVRPRPVPKPIKPSANQLPVLLTVAEVGAVLRLTPTAVYSMIERGHLPGVVRIGRRVRVREDVLLDFLCQKSTPSLEGR